MDAAGIIEVFVYRVTYDANVLVNLALSDHGGSHETIVINIIEGMMIFHFTEVNRLNKFHLYEMSFSVFLLDKIHKKLEIPFS